MFNYIEQGLYQYCIFAGLDRSGDDDGPVVEHVRRRYIFVGMRLSLRDESRRPSLRGLLQEAG